MPAAPKTGTYAENIGRAKAAIKAADQYQARQYLKWAYQDNAQGLEVNSLLGKMAERDNEPEKAEKYYAVCVQQAPADTVVLEQHGRLALACLQLHPTPPNPKFQEPDYLTLAVNDFSALIAANHRRYLLARATAYSTRAKFTAKPGGEESARLVALARQDVEH